MRINVYAEEVTGETALVTKTVTDDELGTRIFYGARFYLASPDVLHSSREDDDRSAVTIWVPWSRKEGLDFARITRLFAKLATELFAAASKEGVAHGDG